MLIMSLEKDSQTDDKTYCKSIAKSISDIIRFSLDEEFRKKCFDLFEVSSTQETEREIKKRLISLTQKENIDFRDLQRNEETSQSQSKLATPSIKDKESFDTQCAVQKNKETIPTPSVSTDNDKQAASQSIFKRNWLQISSQQYKEIIKRKKLNYYSQPQFSQRLQNDYEFLHSNSQTSSSSSSLSLEEKISYSEPLVDTANYCKEKFRDLFKNNAHKYFNKNLKSQRPLSEY